MTNAIRDVTDMNTVREDRPLSPQGDFLPEDVTHRFHPTMSKLPFSQGLQVDTSKPPPKLVVLHFELPYFMQSSKKSGAVVQMLPVKAVVKPAAAPARNAAVGGRRRWMLCGSDCMTAVAAGSDGK
jgi:hypothetical protein